MSQSELDAIDAVVREVLINLQNSSGDTLTLNNFALTAGQWDPAAPSGIPVQGTQLNPGDNPTYGNATGVPFTGVAGSLTLGVNAVTVQVTWSWAYGGTPSGSVNVTGSTSLVAAVTLSNTTSTVTTATVTFSGA